jgi:hypothetical protein
MKRKNVRFPHETVERLDIARTEHPLDRFGQALTIVISDF